MTTLSTSPEQVDPQAQVLRVIYLIGGNMDLTEQAKRLAPFFLNRDPGDPPPDPGTLGDPAQYDGVRIVVDLLQEGRPPDWVYDRLPSDLKVAMLQAGGDPADLQRQRLTDRWTVLGIKDLLTPPKRPEYLISDMVRRPGLVCVYGVPGDLKTMILMDLAVCVAGGDPWLDPLPGVGTGGSYTVKQGPVLWMDMDNAVDRLQERFGAMCRARGLEQIPLHAVSLPRPIFDASKPDEAELLAAQIKDLGAVTCIVDNLGTVSGGRDENSSEMVDVMANLRWAAQDSGSTIWVIHHARKGTGQGSTREGDRLRGHSSIEASLDLALLVERVEDDLTIRSTKTRDDPVRPFTVRWTFDKTPEGALDTARFWHIEEAQPTLPAYVQLAQDLPALLQGMASPPNQSQLVKAMADEFTIQRKAALQAIRYAVTHGLIREQGGAGKTSPKEYHAAVVVGHAMPF